MPDPAPLIGVLYVRHSMFLFFREGLPLGPIMTRAPTCSAAATELLEESVLENPYPFFARLRHEHPLSRVGDTGVHLVATWEGILEVLDREADFSANLTGVLIRDEAGEPTMFEFPGNFGSQVIATADEPEHAVHRRVVRPRLLERHIAGLEPRIRSWVRRRMAPWVDAGGGDFVPLAEAIPAQVVGHLLGLPDGDVEKHRLWAMMGGEILAGDVSVEQMISLSTETAEMATYLSQHLEQALAASPAEEKSLLDVLADAVDGGEISKEDAVGIAIVMFGAGGESTSSLLGSALRLLAEDPALAERLREAPDLIPRFVEECVRLEPPFKFHYRVVRQDCEFMGYDLVCGDRLMLMWASANRDPAVFDAPDEMRFDREHPKHHMSFGRGAHFCVGVHLARMEARVVIEEVLEQTRDIALIPETPAVHARSIFVRRLSELPLRVVAVDS